MVQRYKFKFEKILNLKRREEEQQEDKYLRLKKEVDQIRDKIKVLEEEKQGTYNQMRVKANKLDQILELRRYLKQIRKTQSGLEEQKQAREAEAEKELQILLEKKQERKTLEKLKENEEKAFMKEFVKKEQKELDELCRNYSLGGSLN
jgi:flagellar export protein FliJ